MDYLDLDLEDTRLDASFPASGEVRHISYHSDPDIGRRMIEEEEIWRTKDNLGEGGFGTVWLQERISHNGPKKSSFRAVKMLDKSGKSADMYKKELMAMAKFSKPLYRRCFIECYGWYLQAEKVCIAMEYARHQDLQKHLTKPFPENEAGLIASQVAEGLRFMHDNKYAHRDLKPANIMVMYPGPDWWVKIGDFGISKRAIEGVTSLHTKVFTPEYAAPELRGLGVSRTVANGPKDEITYTFAIDMWSFGEICVRLLTKSAAFPELMQLVNYKLYGIFLPDDALYQNGLGSDCRSFIRKAMDMNPESRFTAEEAQGHPWITKFKKAPFSQDAIIPTPPSSEVAPIDDKAEETFTASAQCQSQGTAEWDTVEPLQVTAISRDKTETSQAPDTRSSSSALTDKLTDEEPPVLESSALGAAITKGSSLPVESDHGPAVLANQEGWATILEPSSSFVKNAHGPKSQEVNVQSATMQNTKPPRNTANGKLASSLSQDLQPGDYLLVLHDFIARSSDEITIKKGQIVLLIETDHEFQDDWWLGEDVTTKKRGIFPAPYTRKASLYEEQLSGIHIGKPLQSNALASALASNGASQLQRNPSSSGSGLEKIDASVAHEEKSVEHGLGKYVSGSHDLMDKLESADRAPHSRARDVMGFFRRRGASK